MADNVVLNPGVAGDTIAADDVGGAKHQRIKLEWGPDGTVNEVDDAAGKRVPVDQGHDGVTTVVSGQVSATTNTTTTRATTTGLGKFSEITALINVTGAGVATGVLQLFLEDSADGGTTYDDLISSNTFTFGASLTNQQFTISGRVASSRPQAQAAQQETLAAGTVRQGAWGDRIRLREKVSGVSGSPTGATYSVTLITKR